MVIVVAVRTHHTGAMPEWCTPPAPVGMGFVSIENKPTAFHLRISQLGATAARHLTGVEWQIHMFSGVAVQVVDL